MQKTLFLYIFKDLLRIFLLTSGALAGIMSFGGLLRPLTQHGLDLGQVSQMLGYFLPAMTNYSWPIAVLFATTFVYGRLSADNELTACRAAGMSYLHILIPAAVLGLSITMLSAFFLAFVVPHSFLKAEKVVYSNLAQLVAGQIDRTQRVTLNSAQQSVTIFARSAQVLAADPARPNEQRVQLDHVAIVTYLNDKAKDQPKVPEDFYLSESVIALITMPRDADGDVQLTAYLADGAKIPRASEDRGKPMVAMSIETTRYGPMPLQSPVRETAKFMDVYRLLDLRANPEKSRRIVKHLDELARIDQRRAYQQRLYALAHAGRSIALAGRDGARDVTYTIDVPRGAAVTMDGDKLSIVNGTPDKPAVPFRADSESTPFSGRARQVVIDAIPDPDNGLVYARFEVRDAVLNYQNAESDLQSKEWNVATPMTNEIARLSQRTARQYLADDATSSKDRVKKLRVDVVRQQNQIESELNARVGFASSCLLLAMVGAAIGMLFKSGNFVSAFAVSVGPALLSIVLIVTGQHICETMPHEVGNRLSDPLPLGLSILWAGNICVAGLGLALYHQVSRT